MLGIQALTLASIELYLPRRQIREKARILFGCRERHMGHDKYIGQASDKA